MPGAERLQNPFHKRTITYRRDSSVSQESWSDLTVDNGLMTSFSQSTKPLAVLTTLQHF